MECSFVRCRLISSRLIAAVAVAQARPHTPKIHGGLKGVFSGMFLLSQRSCEFMLDN
jgi:hypothetical protein